MVVSTFSQHNVLRICSGGSGPASVFLSLSRCVCVCVSIYCCDVQMYAFRFQKTDLYSFGHSSAFFCLHSHFMSISSGLRCACYPFLHSNKFKQDIYSHDHSNSFDSHSNYNS